jgi:hypothetical protein
VIIGSSWEKSTVQFVIAAALKGRVLSLISAMWGASFGDLT